MEINVNILKEFILKRLKEEKDKDNNTYICLNGNGIGMHYYNQIMNAIPYIFEDIEYALNHPEVLGVKEKSLNDYNSVQEAIDNLYKYYDDYIIDFTVIMGENINRYHLSPIAITEGFSCMIIDELVYQGYGMEWIDSIMRNNSYHLMYFEDHKSLSLLIHV